jgi:small-conductance mechanosensitive channel
VLGGSLAWFVATCAFASGVGADAPTTSSAAATTAVATAGPAPTAPPVDLVVANRHLFTMRATNEYGATPAVRAAGVEQRLAAIVDSAGPLDIALRDAPGATSVLVDGSLLFRVLSSDVNVEIGESTTAVAARAAKNLALALRDLREARDSRYLLRAAGKAVIATVVLSMLLWLLVRGYGKLRNWLRGFVQKSTSTLVPPWGQHVVSGSSLEELAIVPARMLAWALASLLLYEWAALMLRYFPYTRPWGETLFDNLVQALAGFAAGILRALPGLAFVGLIFVIARVAHRALHAFFEGVATGRIEVGWLDDATARPTGRLVSVVVWLFALVAAYPYIPGSGSEAFKGIGVFIGLMMSLGASGIVSQAVSGMMLMYTRTLRPGEFVQIGDTEGTITSVGFLTTRIETLRNVEVNVPNAFIAGNVTRNYSRLAHNGGMRLATSVTIGYDTPWRQVRAMLLLAAERADLVSREPPPRVLQTALQDFYVEYTLIVCIADPRRKQRVLDDLHAQIQDVFNEHGVQIMSPHYETDPAAAKVVPMEQWYAPPAGKPETKPAATARETG